MVSRKAASAAFAAVLLALWAETAGAGGGSAAIDRMSGATTACTRYGCINRPPRTVAQFKTAAVRKACFPEIQSLCSAYMGAPAKVGACLKANAARVSPGCRAAIAQ